jgi:hypothetical protein
MLDTATVSAWVTAHSVSQIKITKLYNRAGGTIGNLTPFSGTSIYLILNASGLGAGKATIDLFTGSAFFVSAGSVTINQPFFVATAISADVSMAGNDQYFGDTALGVYSQYRTSSSSFAVSGGSGEVVRAATTVTFHAVQTMLLNTGSGTVYIDGTGTTGSGVGTTGIANILRVGAGFGSSWAGRFSELGVWGIAPTAQNNIDIDANIRLRWGF